MRRFELGPALNGLAEVGRADGVVFNVRGDTELRGAGELNVV